MVSNEISKASSYMVLLNKYDENVLFLFCRFLQNIVSAENRKQKSAGYIKTGLV